MKCENGCGKDSTYITKKQKHVCNKVASKCEIFSQKGKKKSSRKKASEYIGNLLCEYCNIHNATHVLVCGLRCCSSTAGNCKEIRKRAGKSISESRQTINESTGLTNAQIIAQKISHNKSLDIDENGENAHIRNAKNVASIKTNKINDDGLNVHQLTGLKYTQWCDTKEGKNYRKISSERLQIIQNTIDPVTGEKESSRRARKMVETKITNIDENGLNGFERSHWKMKKKNCGFIEGVFWQYSYEKKFLESLVDSGLIYKIKRGPAIQYTFKNKTKTYLPDFIIDNTIYEIKSRYTLFGSKNEYLNQNIAKLHAAVEFGYIVYIVIDGQTILFDSFIDSISNLLE